MLALLVAVTGLRAQLMTVPEEPPVEPAIGQPPIRLIFAPPELPGRFVLGVFDATGSLVRRLVTDRDASVFDQGLNGYITYWDGLDDAGLRCPAGTYAARGFVVGDAVSIRGEAFHFNDWVDEASDAAVTRVMDVELVDPANLVVLFESKTGPVLERVPVSEAGTGWTISVPGATGLAGIAGSAVRVVTEAGDRAYALEDGTAVASEVRGGDAGEPPVVEGARVLDWTAGPDGTKWAVVETGALTAVVQVGTDGEILRTLPPDEAGFVPTGIGASNTAEAIAVLEVNGAIQRVRMMVLETAVATDGEGDRPVSDWRIVLERMITPNEEFGVADGRATPAGGADSRGLTAEVALDPNELDPDGRVIELSAAFDSQGSYLATENGLLLVRVSDRAGLKGVAVVPGTEPGSVRLFQGNGSVVEEFVVSNLSRMAAFDCGDFDLYGVDAE